MVSVWTANKQGIKSTFKVLSERGHSQVSVGFAPKLAYVILAIQMSPVKRYNSFYAFRLLLSLSELSHCDEGLRTFLCM